MATTRLMHDGNEKDTESNTELGRLFQEYLDAADAGRDVSEELLARAGAARDELGAKMRVHRELCALSRSIGERSEPEAPEFLGRFRILDSLGRGGLSRVLLAHDIKLGRRVALKLLARDELPDREKRAWVLNEARSLATLEHSGVVRVYEVDESGSQSFIAMELLVGPSLGAIVAEWRRVRSGSRDEPASAEVRDLAARLATTSAKVELLAGLAEALAYCHDHRVLHRDIKPENVQFDALGRPKLIDFGLAHMSDAKEDSSIGLTQALVGTAAYIAPEQVSSDRTGADPQSDQFSFGTLAYECLALENPFQRPTRRATLDAVEAAHPEPLRRKEPSLPPDLALVVHHALERLPGERYPSMSALAADLRAIQQSRPLSIRPPSPVHVGRLWLQRHRRGARVASVVLALAAAAWAFSFGMTTRAEHELLLEQLAAIQPESFSGTKELLGSFEPLFHLQSEARGFDAGFLRAGLWGPLTPEVRRTVEAWSRSLSLTFARENRESAELGVPMQDLIYRQLFWEDEKLWPESPFNVENRSRGTVAFPRDELKEGRYLLTLLTPLFGPNGNSVFLGTTLTELLVPGYYRLQVWDDGAKSVRRAVCFNVPRGWPDRMRIELHEPRPELLERSIPFDRTTCPITAAVEKGGQIQESQQDLHVGSFALLDDLVTVKDFEKFLALARPDEKRLSLSWPRQFQHSRAPDASAICSYEQALEFAAWAGGRLPTSPELLIAEASGLIKVRQPTQDASGEFLCGCLKGIFSWLCYSRRGKAVDLVIDPVVDMVGLGLVAPGFRIVFDLDEPEFYTHTATHPIAEK